MNGHDRFHLEIHGIAEFAIFCALIRNLSDDKLQELTARLSKSTDAEQAAVDAAKET